MPTIYIVTFPPFSFLDFLLMNVALASSIIASSIQTGEWRESTGLGSSSITTLTQLWHLTTGDRNRWKDEHKCRAALFS
uniref:Secreted protein n=1 Tax=Ditylenchus dipsaci TaxID=166011 RepID=A0A915E7M4_9BILA